MLWGLGVGYVISGMYFGWNLGLPQGGPFGLLIATLLVTLMYGAFVFSYAELACAIPKAGGAFDYAHQAFGPRLGFLAGVAQWVEFVFAPPAIAWARAGFEFPATSLMEPFLADMDASSRALLDTTFNIREYPLAARLRRARKYQAEGCDGNPGCYVLPSKSRVGPTVWPALGAVV